MIEHLQRRPGLRTFVLIAIAATLLLALLAHTGSTHDLQLAALILAPIFLFGAVVLAPLTGFATPAEAALLDTAPPQPALFSRPPPTTNPPTTPAHKRPGAPSLRALA